MNLQLLNRWIDPLKRRVYLTIGKALIKALDTSGKIQTVKVSLMKDEVKDGVELIQQYGFTSGPPENSEAVAVCVGGNRDNMLIIATENSENRPTGIEQGDTCIYTKSGVKIWLKDSAKEIIISGADKHSIVSGDVNLGSETLTALSGVVTGECIDPFTGLPHPDKSTIVKARKL